MKISRQNMSDLARTFAAQGETVTGAPPPETQLEIPPLVQPVTEICRPLQRESLLSTTQPLEHSFAMAFSKVVNPGGPYSAQELLLRRGIWRINMIGVLVTTGGSGPDTNYALMALVGPDTLFSAGVHFLSPSRDTPVVASNDFLIHLPTDEWAISLEIGAPAVGAVNRFRGSVLCCRIL